MNHYVAPLFLWLVINGLIAFYLQGAGFLIIPVYFGILAFGIFIITQKSKVLLNLILGIPALLLIAPFIQMFPIGLGLKVLFGSAMLTALTFALLLPVFGTFENKGKWSLIFLLISCGFFAKAHYESGYEKGKAKSNSLVYIYDADTDKANWVTYDKNLDEWTKTYLGQNPKLATSWGDTQLFSKYDSQFTYATAVPVKEIAGPSIVFLKDSLGGNQRYFKIKISPNRAVNRYDIFANEKITFYNFKANGAQQLEQKGSKMNRNGKKMLSYYVVNNEPLEMQFAMDKAALFDMQLLESSFDLLSNPLFRINPRASWMMPTPFVLNDAVVIKKRIKPTPKVIEVPVIIETIKTVQRKPVVKVQDSVRVE